MEPARPARPSVSQLGGHHLDRGIQTAQISGARVHHSNAGLGTSSTTPMPGWEFMIGDAIRPA
jgi:hypothetical protein